MTTIYAYHDGQDGVDLPDVVLALVEDVDGDAGVLAAQAAHAARLEGLHALSLSRLRRRVVTHRTCSRSLSRVASQLRQHKLDSRRAP